MTTDQNWYIIKTAHQTCRVEIASPDIATIAEKWGPYPSREEAIAKRIGLIRAGKCQPE